MVRSACALLLDFESLRDDLLCFAAGAFVAKLSSSVRVACFVR